MSQGSLKLYAFSYPKLLLRQKSNLLGFLKEHGSLEIESAAVFAENKEEAKDLILEVFDVFPNLARCIKRGTFENVDEAVITIEKGHLYATVYRIDHN